MDPGQPRRRPGRRAAASGFGVDRPGRGWFNLEDAFGPGRFESLAIRPGASGFMVGMPNFPAVYAVGAALAYLRDVGIEAIAAAADPLVEACLSGLSELPVELISQRDPRSLAGILAFRHPRAEQLHRHLHTQRIHVMHHAGRLRVAWHGYNTLEDVERFLRALHGALQATP